MSDLLGRKVRRAMAVDDQALVCGLWLATRYLSPLGGRLVLLPLSSSFQCPCNDNSKDYVERSNSGIPTTTCEGGGRPRSSHEVRTCRLADAVRPLSWVLCGAGRSRSTAVGAFLRKLEPTLARKLKLFRYCSIQILLHRTAYVLRPSCSVLVLLLLKY
jgi:hypothetical protein